MPVFVVVIVVFLSEPFPCGKLTEGRWKRSVAQASHSSKDPPETDLLEQYDPKDLHPTKDPFHLLDFNNTQPSPEEDEKDLVRIVGGRECKEGECPWQVIAEQA